MCVCVNVHGKKPADLYAVGDVQRARERLVEERAKIRAWPVERGLPMHEA